MSVPSPFSQRGAASGASNEDCRDYLRTGRCKYGASCKYNHPSNVQSGGGMKMPVDPNEPLFPVRPNEPICQYYMKHGTCKFGQACKFNHPPQSSMQAALVGGGTTTVVMNVGRHKNDAPQIVMSSGDGSSNGTPMMLQFLPQRPDEQDCIFFLKNGRCKYGATCRYHHPINFNQNRLSSPRQDERRQRMQVQQVPEGFIQNVQYISQSGYHQQQQQGGPSSSSAGGTHVVVTDSNVPVTYMTVDNASGKGSYHPGDGYCAPTGAPISHNQDHTSSTSSIASSFDTANSNLDHLVSHGDQQQQQQSGGLWNRQKNNGSHSSLGAYDSNSNRRIALHQSTSDGNIARRNRAASYGSASESGIYMDGSSNMAQRQGGCGGPVSAANSGGTMPAWRTERSPSFDNGRGRSGPAGQYRSRGDMPNGAQYEESQGQQRHGHGQHMQGGHGRRPPPAGGRRRSTEQVDQGLSMMTSALLTMLDTPEEVAGDGYEYDYEDMEYHRGGQMPSTGMPMMQGGGGGRPDMAAPRGRDMNVAPGASSDGRSYELRQGDQRLERDIFGQSMMNSPVMDGRQYHDSQALNSEEGANWLPNWQGTKSVSSDSAQSMSVIQPQHAPNSPHNASNIGLFLS